MAYLDDIITKINTDDKDEEEKKKTEPEKKDEEKGKKDEQEENKEGLLEYSKEFYERFSS